jgi:hypothetical protein
VRRDPECRRVAWRILRLTIRRRRQDAAAAMGLLLACACTAPVQDAAYAVRDSAGIELVESVRPEWSGDEAWRVADPPTLRIGEEDGDAAYQFSDIAGAVRLAGGRIVVADGGSQQVRFYDEGGRFLRAAGGQGAGPGEFTGLTALGPAPSGGVWAYDMSLRRITWLDAAGEIEGMTTLGVEPPVLNAVGALPDGSLVLKQLWGARQAAAALETGSRRDPIAYVRVARDGAGVDTVALVPGRELLLSDENGRSVMTSPLFGHNSVATLQRDLVIIGSTDRFELDAFAADGTLRRRIRIPGVDVSVDAASFDAAVAQRIAAAPPQRRERIAAMLASQPRPTVKPAHGGVRADHSGNLWVAEWVPGSEPASRWTVLAPDGHWLGVVAQPPRFDAWDIGADWMLGVARDSLDVESVVLYSLQKSR